MPKSIKQQAAQDGWSSPCMWFACNKIIEILSHLPCYSSQWNRTVLLFGLPGSFCSINFPYVASLWFCLWISLSPLVSFVHCAGGAQGKEKGVEEWLWLIPMQTWCILHTWCRQVAIKLLAFMEEDMCTLLFLPWKTYGEFLCEVCQFWIFSRCLIH